MAGNMTTAAVLVEKIDMTLKAAMNVVKGGRTRRYCELLSLEGRTQHKSFRRTSAKTRQDAPNLYTSGQGQRQDEFATKSFTITPEPVYTVASLGAQTWREMSVVSVDDYVTSFMEAIDMTEDAQFAIALDGANINKIDKTGAPISDLTVFQEILKTCIRAQIKAKPSIRLESAGGASGVLMIHEHDYSKMLAANSFTSSDYQVVTNINGVTEVQLGGLVTEIFDDFDQAQVGRLSPVPEGQVYIVSTGAVAFVERPETSTVQTEHKLANEDTISIVASRDVGFKVREEKFCWRIMFDAA